MIYKQRIQLSIILISIALLLGQFAALVHSVEHPFHETTDSCQVYLALEHSKDGLVSGCGATVNPIAHSNHQVVFTALLLSYTQTLYSIRAPPSLS